MKKQELLIILIPTFVCIIAWIGFNIYHIAVTSTISNQEAIQIIPINPTFNTAVIDKLKKRETIEPALTGPKNSNTPTVTPPPTKTNKPATNSAQLSTSSTTLNNGGVVSK